MKRNDLYLKKIEENVIYLNDVVVSSTPLVNDNNSEEVLKNILLNEETTLLYCIYKGDKIEKFEKIDSIDSDEWDLRYAKHICFDKEEGCSLDDLKNSYFHFIDLWEDFEGKILATLYCNH